MPLGKQITGLIQSPLVSQTDRACAGWQEHEVLLVVALADAHEPDAVVTGPDPKVVRDGVRLLEQTPETNDDMCEEKMDLKTFKDTPPWEWPEDAGKMFLGIIGDDQAVESDRLLAVELAGNFTVISDELVDALLSILRNGEEPENMRAKAALSLGPVLDHADADGLDDDSAPISGATFLGIQESFRTLYMDTRLPKEVRRRILEASVRAPQDWHPDAIHTAYCSDDEAWKLTAVFSMRWVRGFDDQILEALKSVDPDILYEAVCAAGNWELSSAWSHITALVTSRETEKSLRLAAIDAVASIRPQEAGTILVDLTESDDEDIVEAVYEAMAMAEGLPDDEFDDDEDEDKFLH